MLYVKDIICHIHTFVALDDYYNAIAAHHLFRWPRALRRLRYAWCKTRVGCPVLSVRRCSNVACARSRLYCIRLEPTMVRVLSMYCGPCTIVFEDIPSSVVLV